MCSKEINKLLIKLNKISNRNFINIETRSLKIYAQKLRFSCHKNFFSECSEIKNLIKIKIIYNNIYNHKYL